MLIQRHPQIYHYQINLYNNLYGKLGVFIIAELVYTYLTQHFLFSAFKKIIPLDANIVNLVVLY